MKNIGNLLKELRINNNLTQAEFAKKFFVTANTIGNYENGVRTPSYEFLKQVCDYFKITFDYFEDRTRNESNPISLTLATKDGKMALFDKEQSIYLTPFKYDRIIISHYGYHLGLNVDRYGKIIYSVMIDNFGNVTEYENMILGSKGFFSKFGVIPAYSKKLQGTVLMNYKGDILSKRYDRLTGVSYDYLHYSEDPECITGLYSGMNFNFETDEFELVDLIYYTGEKLNITLYKNSALEYKIKELNNLDTIIDYVKKYGKVLINFICDEFFADYKNCIKLVETFTNSHADLCYCLDYLGERVIKFSKADRDRFVAELSSLNFDEALKQCSPNPISQKYATNYILERIDKVCDNIIVTPNE